MKQVASLRYGVIFKKAFSVPEIFNAFVRDVIGVALEVDGLKIEVDEVETEKSFSPPIGAVDVKFDLYAQDLKNRLVVDIQHERHGDHYDRFLHYACVAILEQIVNADNYRPNLAVYMVVVLTSGDKHKTDIAITDMDPKNREGQGLNELPHKIIYLAPKYVNDQTPEPLREWLRAIDDSLDGEVDEESYTRPEIQRIFDLIEKDGVTPQERAKMIDEFNQAELWAEKRQEGILQGQRQTLIRQMQRKFGDLPPRLLAQIETTEDGSQLETWLDRLLDVSSLAEMGFDQEE